jgi:LuxR family transcriptional regulator, maltose regulon positive regulatory protein
VSGQSGEDIALESDLRAVALMNLGTVEAWSGLPDAEHHLREGALLARQIGRPYLEVSCLAQLGFAPKARSFAAIARGCREAIALAERYGWGAEPIIAPALIALAGTMVWTGEFDEGERWLQRTAQALQTDTGPEIRLLVHIASGMRASSGEIRNARAVICLAEGDPAGALGAVQAVLDGTAPVIGNVTVVEADLLAGLAHRELGDLRAANEAAERALALAESDRLVLPFAMTGSRELLEALPRHETAHAALLADILDVLHGSSPATAGRTR